MICKTLVSSDELAAHIGDPRWIVLDCRFVLTDPDAGLRSYHAGHIPGARYAHLGHDLSAPVTPGSGRHPLPYPNVLAETLGRWGVDKTKQVVAYDDSFGSMAVRLWWLLRWLGHEAAAVLDGDVRKWQREGRPMTGDSPAIEPTQFYAAINDDLWVDTASVEKLIERGDGLVIDARSEERFSGDIEPLDKVAGHIPGAVNAPFEDNLDVSGAFLPPTELRERYGRILDDARSESAVHMCGSGVTACHNILAMEHAGFSGSKLYPGSWSEWITDPKRPVAKGE